MGKTDIANWRILRRFRRGLNACHRKVYRIVDSIEPEPLPDVEPDDILRKLGWSEKEIATYSGQLMCLRFAVMQCRYAIWQAIMDGIGKPKGYGIDGQTEN